MFAHFVCALLSFCACEFPENPKHKNLGKLSWNSLRMKLGNITTNLKVKIDFTLPEFSPTKISTWNFHLDEYDKGKYNMILVRYL